MTLKGFLAILLVVLIGSGIGGAWNVVSGFAQGIISIVMALPHLLPAIDPLVGLSDWVRSKVILIAIILIASWAGVIITKKAEKKLFSIILTIVGVISTVSMFVGLL